MAIEIINVGTSPNDGNGDPIRDAFIKCNDNFDELETTKISGSGTDNYVPKFNGSNAIENSQIFDNGTNVGIGTTSPSGEFEILRNLNGAYVNSILTNSNSNGYARQLFNIGTSGVNGQAGFSYAPNIFFKIGVQASDTNTPIIFVNNNDSERMRITSSGNVGIGTTTPDASAILHLRTNSKGFLPPTMTTGERDSIGGPADGLIIYNTDTQTINVFTNSGGWKSLLYI